MMIKAAEIGSRCGCSLHSDGMTSGLLCRYALLLTTPAGDRTPTQVPVVGQPPAVELPGDVVARHRAVAVRTAVDRETERAVPC